FPAHFRCTLSQQSFPSLPLFFPSSAGHRSLPSFPTRRSSDLNRKLLEVHRPQQRLALVGDPPDAAVLPVPARVAQRVLHMADERSEEHTSELQSRENLVCRLLLEKKKNPATCGGGARKQCLPS